jgi:hypothetical protein
MGTATKKTIQQLASENSGYFKMAVSVDCVIFGFNDNELKVLLIKSDLEEFQEQYSLLGDLVHLMKIWKRLLTGYLKKERAWITFTSSRCIHSAR